MHQGQQRMDALQQTRPELYIDGIGWIPADATPMRHAYQHHTQARRFAVMLGRAGEDLEIGTRACTSSATTTGSCCSTAQGSRCSCSQGCGACGASW